MIEFNKTEFGDCRQIMRSWAADGVSVQTCVTSPPYFGLRDYGVEGQLGAEKTPQEYVEALVDVFRAVRDVLTDDGTVWLNAGAVISLGEKSFSKGQALGKGVKPSGNGNAGSYTVPTMRNRRSVWRVSTKPFKGAHFATFPPDLIEPCILAGSRLGDVVLDPFMGSGTVAGVALKYGRRYLGCELNPEYGLLHDSRIAKIVNSRG